LAGIAFLSAMTSGLLFFGMRTGKTKLTLDWFAHRRKMGVAGKALTIVPNPVIRPVWVSEAALHQPGLRVRTVANDPLDFVDAAESTDNDMVVVSWSSLQNIFTVSKEDKKNKRNVLVSDIESLQAAAHFFTDGYVDEIHGAKDHESLRYNICNVLLSQTTSRVGCTGTPFGRRPFALWSQAHLIDRGACLGKSYYFFKQAFGVQKYSRFTRSGEETVYDRSKDQILADKTQPLALSYTMQECGIAIVKPNKVSLKMTSKQMKYYVEAANELIDTEDGAKRANTFVKLRMISSGYVPFRDENGQDRTALLDNTPKLAWLDDIIEQDTGMKVVVFHEYQHTGHYIVELLKKRKVKHAWLYGATSDKAGAVKKFQDGKVDWLLLNNQSGNAGIDLRMADYQIFFESNTSPIIRQQAEARGLGNRDGRAFYIDDLICSRIEERILEFHAEGLDILQKTVFRKSDVL
jgi:hypothetical protein